MHWLRIQFKIVNNNLIRQAVVITHHIKSRGNQHISYNKYNKLFDLSASLILLLMFTEWCEALHQKTICFFIEKDRRLQPPDSSL